MRMTMPSGSAGKRSRPGAAAAELAIVLPFVVFLLVAVLDFARLFSAYLTISNCARNGALYLSDPFATAEFESYATVQDAVLADAGGLSPSPSVTFSSTPDINGNIWVSVSYEFQTVARFPGIPNTFTLSRIVTMRVTPRIPTF